jgi:zinc transport system permease protein
MGSFFDILSYPFFYQAVVAAFMSAIACGIIGTYIVTNRIVFISGGISHASFGGIGIGYFFGINPILGAALFSLLAGTGIKYVSDHARLRTDSAIGIFWSFGMAIGIIFIYITPGYAPNLMTYLFGSILTVSLFDLIFLGSVTLVILLTFLVFYRLILFVSFDPAYARSQGWPVLLAEYLLMGLVSLTIVTNIRVVGIILVISLLTIPQSIANLYFTDFKRIMVTSVVIAFLASMAGLFIAYGIDIPSGPSIIFCLVLTYLVLKLVQRTREAGKRKRMVS